MILTLMVPVVHHASTLLILVLVLVIVLVLVLVLAMVTDLLCWDFSTSSNRTVRSQLFLMREIISAKIYLFFKFMNQTG